ncbi:MAG: mechanosensitive ion channel family protein, partial [Beijerinckiaceae bacterium]
FATSGLAQEAGATNLPQGFVASLALSAAAVWHKLAPIVAALPNIPMEIASALAKIIASDPNSVASLLTGFALMAVLIVLRPALRRIMAVSNGDPSIIPVLTVKRFFCDIALAMVTVFLAIIMLELIRGSSTLAASLAESMIDVGLRTHLALLVPLVLLRPNEPTVRLLSLSDRAVAKAMMPLAGAIIIAIAFMAVIPVLLNGGMEWATGQAFAVCVGAIVAVFSLMAALAILREEPSLLPHWRHLAFAATPLFWIVWSYGVITLDFPFFNAVVAVGAVSASALVVDRFLARVETAASVMAESVRREKWAAFAAAFRRTSHAFAGAALLFIAAHWAAMASEGTRHQARLITLRDSLGEALIVVMIGYLLFETFNAWSRSTFANPKFTTMPGDGEEGTPASRLSTVAPLARGLIGVAILGAAILIAISRLGVDITPILAGAGILGLAISFGSQSLVRDVVAGIFYLADDAFRLGEYIEASKLTGTVEKISLRSMRVRHQNGHIHTIPFGQLGAVTNFSRDWNTMKFNLRMDRSTDVERVRKVTKQLGLAMLDDEEHGPEFIQQLKMQGIADVSETALVLRFKFTVRPGKPTIVRREVMKRLLYAFAENNIAFASNSIIVQSAETDIGPRGAAAGSFTNPVAVG